MKSIEAAIEVLKELAVKIKATGMVFEAVHMAIDAMEKQKPKKVTHEATLHRCHTCPRCRNVIDEFIDFKGERTLVQVRNCKFCGQTLLWEDTE